MLSGTIRELKRLYRSYDSFNRDHGSLLAAAAAYFIGLSLFPLLSSLIAGFGWFLGHTSPGQNAEQHVMATVEQHVSPLVASQVQELFAEVRERSPVSGPISILTLLFVATAGFTQFENAFNRIWNIPVPESRGWLAGLRELVVERAVAFLLMLAIAAIVVATFLAATVLTTVQARTHNILPAPAAVWTLGQTAASLAINVIAFTMLYRWLPKTHVPWRPALRGATLVAVAWEVGRQVLAAFLVGTKYSSAYGIVGTFIGLLVWCYYACLIVFLGAEYVQGLIAERKAAACYDEAFKP